MSRRIDIELTSALADGSWTWRAAGARKPNGVVDGSILPAGSAVGDVLKVEVEQMLDGIEVQSVVKGRDKSDDANVLELLPSERPFEAVIETRAKRDRSDRRDRDRRDVVTATSAPSATAASATDVPGRVVATVAPATGVAAPSNGDRTSRRRPRSPSAPSPSVCGPARPAATRSSLRSPKSSARSPNSRSRASPPCGHASEEDNVKLEAEGKPTMPETGVVKMAEDLLPKLRVAEWLDRAEAAKRQMEHLDLRDLRSVVAASEDSIVARDESTRELAQELRASLVRKQDEELLLWFGDIDAAIGVGRVIRALRLSSQPPKAGVMFPPELARRLSEAATAALLPDDPADRWIAVLEAVAFSPVRTLVAPTAPPTTITDDLRATVLRLGPALPQIAALLGVEVPPGAPKPKPLRQQPRARRAQRSPAQHRPRSRAATPAAPPPPTDAEPASTEPASTEPTEPASTEPARPRPPRARQHRARQHRDRQQRARQHRAPPATTPPAEGSPAGEWAFYDRRPCQRSSPTKRATASRSSRSTVRMPATR
jgi:hypothetical protein